MSVKDDVQEFVEKSASVSREFFLKAGNTMSRLGDEGVVRVEKLQLEKQLKKLIQDFGETVADRFLVEEKKTVSLKDKNVSVLLNEISRLKNEIKKRQEILNKNEKKSQKK